MNETIAPAIAKHRPDILMISCGLDLHATDPLGGMSVTDEGVYQMSVMAREWAERYCNGRLLSILEGGYNLQTLGKTTLAHFTGLSKD